MKMANPGITAAGAAFGVAVALSIPQTDVQTGVGDDAASGSLEASQPDAQGGAAFEASTASQNACSISQGMQLESIPCPTP